MVESKRLGGGGDKAVPQMVESASMLGIDLIELMWIPRNGQRRSSVAQINGFRVPIMGEINYLSDNIEANGWIDSTLKFFPDNNGTCWGYVFDTPENRELLYRSFNNGRFRIVDKKVRDEIYTEALDRGFSVTPPERVEVMVKASIREHKADEKAKELERKLKEMEIEKQKLEIELELANNDKLVRKTRRLTGVSIPNKEAALDNLENMKNKEE